MLSIKDVVIDKELEELLPPLSVEERLVLVESVKKDGFSDPLIVWLNHSILIDGHNRWHVWQSEFKGDDEHAPEIIEKHFADRDAVKEFMLRRQLGRRNLIPAVRAKLALALKPVLQSKAKENQKQSAGRGQKGLATLPNLNSRDEVAKAAGVSSRTLGKTETVLKSKDEKTKADMLNGKISINEAHKKVSPPKSKPTPPAEEPKQDKRTEFDPTKFDPAMKPEDGDEKVDTAKMIQKCDQLVLSTESKLAASFEDLKRAVRAIDDANDAKPVPNHKSILGHYGRLFKEMEEATATMIQFTKSWKFRK